MSASTRARIRIGCSIPGYSGYDSTRSKVVSARTRSTSNSGTNATMSPAALCGEDDGPLRREEAEGREVLDVVLIEEDVAREACAPHLLEQPLATRLQLFRRDAVTQLHALNHLSSTGDRWPIMHC